MPLAKLELSIELTVKSPFMFKGLHCPAIGVDVAHLRAVTGRPVIPGDQVRGVLRSALSMLARETRGVVSAEDVAAVFGPEVNLESDLETAAPTTKALRLQDISFTDLEATELSDLSSETTRIEIDDDTGAAKTGALQVIELVAPFGRDVSFHGRAQLHIDEAKAKAFVAAMRKALATVPALGAFKTAGFGEIVHTRSRITETASASLSRLPARSEPATSPISYSVTFDRPVLVDAHWVTPNAFSGSSIIPGSVFKGAIAQRIRRSGTSPDQDAIGDALSRLRISHAFPQAVDGRTGCLAMPLSLVASGADTPSGPVLGDALQVPVDRGAMMGGSAALFIPDWKAKHFARAQSELDLPQCTEPTSVLRTHTAIDDAGSARDQHLFTSIARSHLRPDGSKSQWVVSLSWDRWDDETAQLLSIFEAGLDGIGKTNATAQLSRCPLPTNAARVAEVDGTPDHYAIVLRTPSLLTDPLSSEAARSQYAAYFADTLGGELVSFFAQQRLVGRYLAQRYRALDAYYPWLLTEPGSVFLVRPRSGSTSSALRERLETYISAGLPVKASSRMRNLDWRSCPFVPENGFGAFTADYLSNQNEAALLDRVQHG